MNRRIIWKKVLSGALCALLAASVMPMSALAAEDGLGLITAVSEAVDAAEPVEAEITAEAAQESETLRSASGALGTNLAWALSEDGVLTISGTGEMPYCEMESQIPWKNYRFDIQKVVVEEGVTTVGPFAFYNCYLLKEVTLPDTVRVIERHAFDSCRNLVSVELPESLTEVGVVAFYECQALEELVFPASVKTLAKDAFMGCYGLTSVTFLGALPAIDATAFRYVTTTCYYPDGDAQWIANGLNDYGGTLTWKPLSEKPGPGDDPVVREDACGDDLTWTLTAGGTLTVYGTGPMWDYAATDTAPWYGEDVKKVIVEEGVTAVGAYAFYDSWELTEVSLPDTLETIRDSSFHNCPILPSVTIPESVTTIGEKAFYVCESLQEITIPDSVTSLGREAFKYCAALKSVTLGDGLPYVIEGAFCECDSLTDVTIGGNITKIYSEAFAGCDSLKEVTIPARITLIVMGNNDFPAGAFSDCGALENIYVEAGNSDYCDLDGVVYTGDMTALVCCPAGKTGAMTVPATVEEIGHSAFYGCDRLTGIGLPNSVDTIGVYAFCDCDRLASLNIPASVTYISSRAFYDCDGLTEVRFRGTIHPTMSWDSFEYTVATGYYPEGAEDWELYLSRLSVGGYRGEITWTPYTLQNYDMNGDGATDGRDLVRLMRHVIGLESVAVSLGDLNGDKTIDVLDVIRLVRHLAG